MIARLVDRERRGKGVEGKLGKAAREEAKGGPPIPVADECRNVGSRWLWPRLELAVARLGLCGTAGLQEVGNEINKEVTREARKVGRRS